METENGKTGRLFFAILPDTQVTHQIYQYARLIRLSPEEKITRPENLHITLRYIGSVEKSVLNCLMENVDDVACSEFDLTLEKAAYWKKPEITWFGPDSCDERLTTLVDELELLCRNCGIAHETQGYIPHMTILRKSVRRPAANLSKSFHWRVKKFVLLESLTCETGVEYKTIKSWPISQRLSILSD